MTEATLERDQEAGQLADSNSAIPDPAAESVLGDMTLFLPDDYKVTKLGATLGGITIEDISQTNLAGLKVDEETDLVIRGAKVMGAKSTHKGEVTLIVTGQAFERLERLD